MLERAAYNPHPEMPYDVDVEQAVLGAILVDNSWMDRVGGDLNPDRFYDPLHQRLCEAMLALYAKAERVSPLTVKVALGADKGFDEVGGVTYLTSLARAAPALPNVPDYLRIVHDHFVRRQIIHVGQELVDSAYITGRHSPIAPIARMASEVICDLIGGAESRRAAAASDVAMEVLQKVEAARAGEPVPSVTCGLAKLNAQIGGFMGGDLITVPGRAGMGKSALLGSIAIRAALAGHPVLVFSLEMRKEQWLERTLCDLDYDTGWETPVEYRYFRTGKLTDEAFDRVAVAMQRLSSVTLDIIDDDTLTIEDIHARARAFKAKHAGRLGLVLIDYLQIVVPSSQRERSREQEVTGIARGCKAMAKQLDWPVVAGAQILSKEVDKRGEKDRRPTASDVRESGSIENETDIMLAPYRPAYYVESRRPGSDATDAEWKAWQADLSACKHDFELLGLKNRHGPRFTLHLHCDMAASAIRDQKPTMSQDQQESGQGLLV